MAAYAQEAERIPSTPRPSPTAAVEQAEKVDKVEKGEAMTTEREHRLRGTVKDPVGAVIQGAKVSLFSVQTGKKELATNEDGVYVFDHLPAGNYMLEVESPGFIKSARELSLVGRETSHDEEARLGIGFEVTVDVVADINVEIGTAGGAAVVEYSTELGRAVADDDIEKARELIANGADPNGKENDYGKITPVFIAVENGNLEMVKLLLDAGAKLSVKDEEKQTPLMRLDGDAGPELVELLVRHGMKVDAKDKEGNTALIIAAQGAKAEVLKALIDAGADANKANKEGLTPLMGAVMNGDVDAVRVLINAGAAINAKDAESRTALDMADEDEDEMQKLLAQYGAIHGKTGDQ